MARLKSVGLIVLIAASVAACSPGPGSPEWCKGVIEGTIQPTQDQMMQNMDKCAAHEQAGG
ncbi:MAG: hypothetical protein EON61_00350 [Alphaproteobacteria bacterium]|nr:MAG: hypothetical protein EON61_00350 [Alphaproteobacteria bacterium]